MIAFVATSEGVLQLKVLAVGATSGWKPTPQEFRDDCRAVLMGNVPGATHVWFEDEVGGPLDPINGPNPTLGPGAEAMVQHKWDRDYNNPLEKYGMN
jgi:hypothetical protein